HLLGQLLHHIELLQQPVHIHHLQAAAGSDALFPAGVQDLGILPLQRGHGEDDGLRVGQGLVIDGGTGHLAAQSTGHHAGDLAQVTHIPQLLELFVVILQRQAVFPELFLQLGGLIFVVGLLGLFDEGQHIAHTQNAGCHPVRMEGLDHIQLLAGTHELDGLAGGGPNRESSAATGVAVQLGQHHAVDAQRLVKGSGGVHRILAGHGIHHQQDLIGMDGSLHPLQLIH
ncbi:Stage 0 sporulation A-like protein, partial [Dysosmobacter welbionis]